MNHFVNHFYGYGSWSAPLWYVAYEEGGGDYPEEVAEKLDYFYDVHRNASSPTLCDIRDVYKQLAVRWEGPKATLYKNRHEYRFGKQATLNKVWENLLKFSFGYRGESLPDVLQYQKETFGSEKSGEALLRLYPLPGASHHGWNYNWLDLPEEFGFLKSRSLYQDHIFQQRINGLLSNITRHKPEVVLMYGMNNIINLKRKVSQHFNGTKFKSANAVKQKIPQYHWSNVGGTLVLITTQIPALRHNRIETGFDWMAFGAETAKLALKD